MPDSRRTPATDATMAQRVTACGMLSLGMYLFIIFPANATMAYILCQVLGLVQGDIGRGAVTLGVMAVGAQAVMGKASMHLAVTVAVGAAILFGAVNIAGQLGLTSSC